MVLKIIALFISLFLLVLIACGSEITLAEQFEQLKENPDPEARQEFVVKAAQDADIPDDISEVTYDETHQGSEDLMGIGLLQVVMQDLGVKKMKFPISVFPPAFGTSAIKTYADFKSSLQNQFSIAAKLNEGMVRGVPLFPAFVTQEGQANSLLLVAVLALGAIEEEMANPSISDAYRTSREKIYTMFYIHIWDHSNGMDPQLISHLKVEYFPPFFEPLLKSWLQQGRVSDFYIGNPETNIRYYLTDQELRKVIEKFDLAPKGQDATQA